MKTAVAGTRKFKDYEFLRQVLDDCPWEITEIVCGMCEGVDMLGKRYAEEKGIPVSEFHARWDIYDRAAGPIRNAAMAEYADALICIWDGSSSGSKNMIEEAQARDLKVLIKHVNCG